MVSLLTISVNLLIFEAGLTDIRKIFTEEIYLYIVHISSLSYASLNIILLIALKNRISLINENVKNIKTTLILHDKFCDTISLVNKCFSFNFSITLLEFNFHCILFTFSACNMLLNKPDVGDKTFFFAGLVFIGYALILIVCILVYSSLIKSGGKQTLIIVHALENVSVHSLTQIASLQLSHRQPEISCGLYTIDWKFLFAILSCVFSYTIILIQFDVADTYKSLKINLKSNGTS